MKRHFWIAVTALIALTSCSEDAPKTDSSIDQAVCGDHILDDSEACDDGNTQNGDGCAADCTVESGYQCDKNSCVKIEPDHVSECGDGTVEAPEVCDDGNTEDGDGCAADCAAVEAGWTCPERGGVCEQRPRCGDGIIAGNEACDDGNTDDGDGCAADCSAVEAGFRCPKPGVLCTPMSCGNGIRETDNGEQCDDGFLNTDYGFGACATNCQYAHYCGDGRLDGIDLENGEQCDTPTDTSKEYNGCNDQCQIVNFCGDGKIQSDYEQCDDGNTKDGDGCTSKCAFEPNWICATKDGKSHCSPILCGNGQLDGDEECDDGNRDNGDGCSSLCLIEYGAKCEQVGAVSQCVIVCGDGVLDGDLGETCDDGNRDDGDGCSAKCLVEKGYTCSGTSCFARACGDGIVAGNEECDDANGISGDGCSKFCKREKGWHCDVAGQPCQQDVCGDGVVTGSETCDEGILANPQNQTLGCVDCQIQKGWQCVASNASCVEAQCGNGILEGIESCEEESECCVECTIQSHCACDEDGKNCVLGQCQNGILEADEECDDGNDVAGDGCGPDCQVEAIFDCYDGVCKATCGDGLTLKEAGEECDDGNLVNGDGCSSECQIESGFECTIPGSDDPAVLNLPIIYRDFRAYHYGSTGNQDYGNYKNPMQGPGFLTPEAFAALPDACKQKSTYRFRHFPIVGSPLPDFNGNGCWGDHKCQEVVYKTLSEDGRPMLRPASDMKLAPGGSSTYEACHNLYTCPEVFDYWYRDTDMSLRIDSTLPLTKKIVNGQTIYQFVYTENGYANSNFWPLDGKGFHATNAAELYGRRETAHGLFTSEFQTYFKFSGGEKLTFEGDDDVWVFFNGHLALEFAGIHGNWGQTIELTPETAAQYGMYPGGIYSLQMFHAERCQGGSTYTLTLAGFVNMGTSECTSRCGDGLVRGDEECDFEGDHSDVDLQHAHGCSADCKIAPYCGNGILEKGEQCEPTAENAEWCTTSCVNLKCQNGTFDPDYEQCDPSAPASDLNVVEDCLDTCRLAGCGDGNLDIDRGEECDDGNLLDSDMCTHECKRPSCGDGIVSPAAGEICDDGINSGVYGGCGLGCAYAAPRCGDGLIDKLSGEECDDGDASNIGGYGRCTSECKLDIRCGDGIVQEDYEQCDGGTSCTTSCTLPIN